MEHLFIPYHQASELIELGFDEPCLKVWSVFPQATQNKYQLNNEPDDWASFSIKAPLYQQAFKWFREKHNLAGYVLPFSENEGKDDEYLIYIISVVSLVNDYDLCYDSKEGEGDNTYEEAELTCLKQLIKTIK